jgi:hypothetical protein
MGSPISKETFLQRACARFADHYDYSEIVYKSYKSPILIRCRLHPVKLISITPEKHLQTSGGCKYCLRDSRIRMLERELHRAPAVRERLESPKVKPPEEPSIAPEWTVPRNPSVSPQWIASMPRTLTAAPLSCAAVLVTPADVRSRDDGFAAG